MQVSDNFNRADENPLSNGGKWSAQSTTPQCEVLSNAAAGSNVALTCVSLWTGDTFGGDQFSQATVASNSTFADILGVIVRADPSSLALYKGTWTNASGGTLDLLWVDATGHVNSLGTISGFTVNPGDVLRLQVTGTSLQFSVNGSVQLSATDSNFSSGSPGILILAKSGAASATTLDDWSGGDNATTPTSASAPYVPSISAFIGRY